MVQNDGQSPNWMYADSMPWSNGDYEDCKASNSSSM